MTVDITYEVPTANGGWHRTSTIEEEVVVVAFDTAGYISAVTSISPEYAQSTARQLRYGGRSVKCMSREDFTALQEQEAKKREQEKTLMGVCFNDG